MSHGILENDEMFSVKERPWHGLGKIVQDAPSIEEAIRLANLDWTVSLHEIETDNGIRLGNKRAIIRDDIKECLGVLTDSYKPLQNTEAFDFFQPFLDNELASLETAGSLFNGKRVWILAKIKGENISVSEDDQIEKYILLSNSHDGSQAVKVGFSPIRVVCNNTLTAAEMDGDSSLIRVYHKGDIKQSLTELQETMDLVNKKFMMTEQQYRYLASRNVSVRDLEKYVQNVFSTKSLESIVKNYEKEQMEHEEVENARKRLLARVEEIFELEPAHNAWTLYNSVNFYLNHERGRSIENRYDSLWFGYGKRVDQKAFALAMKH